MTIKARLILSVALVLCVATIAIGAIAIGAVSKNMTERADQQLRQYVQQPVSPVTELTHEPIPFDVTQPDMAYTPVALLAITQSGEVVNELLAGYSTDRLSPPEVPNQLPPQGEIVTVSAEDGSVDYRLMSLAGVISLPINAYGEPVMLVAAYPLTELAVIRDNLVSTMVAAVIVLLIASAVASWWITKRGLQPVESMVDTAAAIANGDLSRRATAPKNTEMGRLATSLNWMVNTLVNTISDREAGQAQLRRFIGDASHELRTPLATISGYTELYESGGARSGAELDRAMGRIRAENQRMARLVDDLLLLARLDEDTDDVREPCNVNDLAREVVDDASAAHPDFPVTAIVPEEPVVVHGDGFRLQQVMSNLVNNAREHTPPGTPAQITVERVPGAAVLSVIDDGPGVPQQHWQKVFERLYRIDESRSRATGGSGLGLSIVESIVNAHGGTVELAHARPGEENPGTKVTIRLPLAN